MRTNLICLSLVLLLPSASVHSMSLVNATLSTSERPGQTSHEIPENQIIANFIILGLLFGGGCFLLYKNWKKPNRAELVERKKKLEKEILKSSDHISKEEQRIKQELHAIDFQLRLAGDAPLLSDAEVELAINTSVESQTGDILLLNQPDQAAPYGQLPDE
jgi:hypothetical protein